MPTATKTSGRIERVAFLHDTGWSERDESASASAGFGRRSSSIIASSRRSTQTGRPRHASVCICPGFRSAMLVVTGWASARARAEGSSEATNG